MLCIQTNTQLLVIEFILLAIQQLYVHMWLLNNQNKDISYWFDAYWFHELSLLRDIGLPTCLPISASGEIHVVFGFTLTINE